MGIRWVRDLGVDACDVVFEDDDHMLAVDDDADVWRVGVDGERSSLGTSAAIHAALADVHARGRASQALPHKPTPRQIAWHGGSGALVVHLDHFGMWSLVGRVGAAGWQP